MFSRTSRKLWLVFTIILLIVMTWKMLELTLPMAKSWQDYLWIALFLILAIGSTLGVQIANLFQHANLENREKERAARHTEPREFFRERAKRYWKIFLICAAVGAAFTAALIGLYVVIK